MLVKLPPKGKEKQPWKKTLFISLTVIVIVGVVGPAIVPHNKGVLDFYLLILSLAVMPAWIVSAILYYSNQFATHRHECGYTHLNFTDTGVILVHTNPAQNCLLPYDKTAISLTFHTGIFSVPRAPEFEYIPQVSISFTYLDTHTINLNGHFMLTSPLICQLLDNFQRFSSHEFFVAPEEESKDKKQQAAAAFIHEQIQHYLACKQMLPISPASRENIRSHFWRCVFVGIFTALACIVFCFYLPAHERLPVYGGIIFEILLLVAGIWAYRVFLRKEAQKRQQITQIHAENSSSVSPIKSVETGPSPSSRQ